MPNTDEYIGVVISDVARLLRTEFDRRVRRLGITRAQWLVLTRLHRRPGASHSELAEMMEVEKATAGRMIDRLVANGWVERRTQPDDRRVKRVYLTKQARGFLEKLRKETDKFNAKIVSSIQRNQLEITSDALLAMKRNLLAMSGETMSEDSEKADTANPAKRRKKKPVEQRHVSGR
jgi:DNA-binding MarR family transcriptional regulator